jgi:hypothetical protein
VEHLLKKAEEVHVHESHSLCLQINLQKNDYPRNIEFESCEPFPIQSSTQDLHPPFESDAERRSLNETRGIHGMSARQLARY